MTMILTCLTKDYVVQASDRRLTRIMDGKVELFKDQSNKALVYANHFVFAYTGKAQLGLTPTIDWAAQKLSEKDALENAVYHLKDRANDVMKNWYSNRSLGEVMVGFVGAGFAEMKERGRWFLKPLRIMISNFTEKNGMWVPVKEFKVDYEPLQAGQKHRLFVSGRPLSKERQNALNKILRWCLRNKRAQRPETIGRFLAREILNAAETDECIGKNIMCTFVPREFINDGSISLHLGGMFLEDPVISTEPQQLKPRNLVSLHDRFAFPPPFDRPRIVYIDNSDNAPACYTPMYVHSGGVIPEINISDISITIPPFIQVPDASVGQ